MGLMLMFSKPWPAERHPKVYFTQSVMQNPTGTDMSPHVAFRVLQAAERHNFVIVEDDIFSDLQARQTPRLATLDQLNRVIYARSFSKTLSGSLRVGFIACSRSLANQLADIKMLTTITTSQFTERLIYLMLVDGHYRKYLTRLQERLGEARINVARAFERIGFELFVEPSGRHVRLGAIALHSRIWLRLQRRPNGASCLRLAYSFVPISTGRPGCGSTSWSATTSEFKDCWRRSHWPCVRRSGADSIPACRHSSPEADRFSALG